MNLAISHRSMASGRLGVWNSGGTFMGSGSYPLARCIRVRFDDVGAVTGVNLPAHPERHKQRIFPQ